MMKNNMDIVKLKCKTVIIISEDAENISDAVYDELASITGYTENVDIDILHVFYTGHGDIEVKVYVEVVLTAPITAVDPAQDIARWIKTSDDHHERDWTAIVEEAYYLSCDILEEE